MEKMQHSQHLCGALPFTGKISFTPLKRGEVPLWPPQMHLQKGSPLMLSPSNMKAHSYSTGDEGTRLQLTWREGQQ